MSCASEIGNLDVVLGPDELFDLAAPSMKLTVQQRLLCYKNDISREILGRRYTQPHVPGLFDYARL